MYDLTKLREATKRALKEAAKQPRAKFKGDAINWKDLHCIEAAFWTNDSGTEGHRVLVEEAAPDSWRLGLFVAALLEQAGFPGVEVQCAW